MSANDPVADATTDPFEKRTVSEEEEANFFSRYLYVFVGQLFTRGWNRFQNKEILHVEDQLLLPTDEDPAVAQHKFLVEWEAEKVRAAAETEANKAVGKPPVPPSLFRALRRAEMSNILIGAFFRLLSDGATIAQPFILQGFIDWLGNYVTYNVAMERRNNSNSTLGTPSPTTSMTVTDTPGWHGFLWAIGLGIAVWLFSFLNNASLFHTMKAFSNMRSAVALTLYDKALKLEGSHGTSGDAMQLHNTDSFKFIEAGFFFQYLWSAPVIIIASLIALHHFIGWAGVLSIVVIMIFVPIQGVTAAKMMAARGECTKWASRRLNAVNEFLQGIRIVKFMGWEDRFEARVAEERLKEVAMFRRLYGLRSIVVILVSTVPMIVSFSVIAIAYALGEDITAKRIFPAIAMLNVLRMPMNFLPLSISKFIDLNISLGRVLNFLQHREMEPYLKPLEDPDVAVKMVHADLQCMVGEGDRAVRETLLADVNVTIPKGKLTLVIGPTGSGKSTLVHAMVGEGLVSPTSYVGISQSVAYVTQEAWIMNATVRDNILMGKPFDEEKYIATINNCCLMSDLEQLSASDATEIGERGINLSGGQKQRVAFARAAYSGNELVLCDDPLSAVDPHVCVALFEDCIIGLLSGRTRVLVTHQVQFLPRADHIILVTDRRIAFQGTYDELMASDIDVAAMIEAHTPGSMTPKQNADSVIEASPTEAAAAQAPPSPTGDRVRHHSDKIPEPPKNDKAALISEELQVQGAVSGDTFRWFFGIQGVIPVFLTAISFTTWRAVMVVADFMVSWWSTRTKVIGKTLTEDQYLYWYAIFVALTMFTISIRQIPFVIGIVNAACQSHGELVHSVLHAPTSFFDTTPMGRIMSRFSKDMDAIDLVIPESLNFFYNLILVILGAFAVMIYSAPWLAIVIVVMLVLFAFVFRYYVATNRAQKRLEANNRSPMSNVMNETLGGLPTIRAYRMEAAYTRKHLDRVALSQRSTYGWRSSQRWLSLRVDSLSSVISLATALMIAGLIQSYSPEDQLDALPVMALAVSYAVAIGGAIGYVTQMSAELESAFSSVERIKEYSESIDQENEARYGSGDGEVPAPAPTWPENGTVSFESASCRYREGLPLVLRNVSFTVQSGEKVGIVGRTGSGKSTIMLTLFRMIELAEGRITIAGHDISKLTMRDLRSKITIIPQDPLLFSGTIRSNIDPFGEAKDDYIWGVLRRVGMEERVRRDGNGLECVVAERGANFSVGQRQLLCLARALLKRCKVLLCDEATASVDYESDAMIQRTLRSEFSDCTVLTIAHRLATIIDSDKVVVLDHGELREFGAPADLLDNTGSQFRGMVEQLGDEQFAMLRDQANQVRRAKKERMAQ